MFRYMRLSLPIPAPVVLIRKRNFGKLGLAMNR
jgi:hypothetical protein